MAVVNSNLDFSHLNGHSEESAAREWDKAFARAAGKIGDEGNKRRATWARAFRRAAKARS
ncbi:MAG: hypothetical protein ABSC19_12565 [Syntrophorhabdales bacterium]|jgi:hypothetical protein